MQRPLRFLLLFLSLLALCVPGVIGEEPASAAGEGTAEQQKLSGLAQAAEAREDWKEAEARLRDLLKLAPDEPNLDIRKRLAHALFFQGMAREAYDVLKEARNIDRDFAARNGTRQVFLTPEAVMGQYYDEFEGPAGTNAEIWFKAAVQHAPNDLTTRHVVALWAFEKGKIDFAKEQAENALRIEAADPGRYGSSFVGRGLRGMVALWEKDWAEAERNFQTIILQSPADFVARNNLALALAEQDDPAKKQRALEYAEANVRDYQANPNAWSTLGWVCFRSGEFDRAGLALEQAVKTAGGAITTPRTATYAAYLLHHRGQDWEAKAILEDLLKSNRPFSMKPEAQKLFEQVKDAKNPK